MYRAREQKDILREMQDSSNTPVSKIEGTFEYDMLAANSVEFAKVEVELEEAYKAAFADTSWGEYLTKRAAEFGVVRKEATKAIGKVRVKGSGRIVAGSLFQTEKGVRYQTMRTVDVVQVAVLDIEALLPGNIGNTGKNTVTKIPMSIPGINSVTNEEEIHGGYDAETDAALLERYLRVVRTPATSGNKYHYHNWAMSIAGVGACRVVPLWEGAGTVKILILDADLKTAPTELIEKVRGYIEDVRPIGATVTVMSPAPKPLTITAAVAGRCDEAALISAINDYLKKKSLSLKYLSSAQVGDLLMNQPSVTDYDDLLLNGKNRVSVSEDQLLYVQEVRLHELSVSP